MYVNVYKYFIKVLLQNILMKMTNFLTILMKSLLYIILLLTNFKYKTLLQTKSIVTLHTNSMTQLKVWSWVTSKVFSACFPFFDWCLDPLVYMYLIKHN